MKEAYRRNPLAANIFAQGPYSPDAIIEEIFSTLESAKAKIPAACPDP